MILTKTVITPFDTEQNMSAIINKLKPDRLFVACYEDTCDKLTRLIEKLNFKGELNFCEIKKDLKEGIKSTHNCLLKSEKHDYTQDEIISVVASNEGLLQYAIDASFGCYESDIDQDFKTIVVRNGEIYKTPRNFCGTYPEKED